MLASVQLGNERQHLFQINGDAMLPMAKLNVKRRSPSPTDAQLAP